MSKNSTLMPQLTLVKVFLALLCSCAINPDPPLVPPYSYPQFLYTPTRRYSRTWSARPPEVSNCLAFATEPGAMPSDSSVRRISRARSMAASCAGLSSATGFTSVPPATITPASSTLPPDPAPLAPVPLSIPATAAAAAAAAATAAALSSPDPLYMLPPAPPPELIPMLANLLADPSSSPPSVASWVASVSLLCPAASSIKGLPVPHALACD
eukprot:532977-Pelagomonas_calceolata.AAC.4